MTILLTMKTIIIALTAVCVFAAGIWFALQQQNTHLPLDIAGIHLNKAKDIGEFNLRSATHPQFDKSQLKGHWTFIYFGYSYCPDACPLALTQLNAMDKFLSQQSAAEQVNYLFISVDPRRDTPERLAEYTAFFNAKFTGATGDVSEIDKLTKTLGVYYAVPKNPEDPENYLVDHSSVIILTNPNGDLQALFSAPHDPAQMAKDFQAIRAFWQNS